MTMRFVNSQLSRRWGIVFAALSVICLATVFPNTAASSPGAQADTGTPVPTAEGIEVVIAVERAVVFPVPDRSAEPLTYLYERESVAVYGKTPDGVFLQIRIEGVEGWILAAQVDIIGDPDLIATVGPPLPTPTPTLTITPFRASPTPGNDTPPDSPPAATPTPAGTNGTQDEPPPDELPAVLPGEPPPLTITLPEDWQALHIVVPFRTLGNEVHDVPLSIYFGPLDGGATGYIYLYWGFPNVVTLNGEYNLWADGVQILRGSLVGDDCQLGVYEQKTFTVGGLDAVGASYQTDGCETETNAAGWFGVVQVYDGTFAFYTAVEPLDEITRQRAALQAILDTVEFLPPQPE
jgi:hypothetical protein